MFRVTRFIACAAAGSVVLSACQQMPTQQASAPTTGPNGCLYVAGDPGAPQAPVTQGQATAIGGVLGGALGALGGRAVAGNKATGTRNGLLLGAVAGALAGSAYGKSLQPTEAADGSVVLNVPGNLLFPTNRYDLAPEFKTTLNSVAESINKYCNVTARVTGHTDNVGNYASNKILSDNRARSVADYLVTQGVSPYNITSEGVADSQPAATNANEAGRQLNRRVVIVMRLPGT